VTGLITTGLYLDAITDLWRTPYGRTLSLKVACFTAAGLMGLVNWRIVRPRLGGPDGPTLFRRTSSSELILAAGVLALTAILSGLPQPHH
jgi:putative copper export protein